MLGVALLELNVEPFTLPIATGAPSSLTVSAFRRVRGCGVGRDIT
jgi:hypothetical protein